MIRFSQKADTPAPKLVKAKAETVLKDGAPAVEKQAEASAPKRKKVKTDAGDTLL